MQARRFKRKYTCDLCGAPVPLEDVVTRVAEAPFGLCCSECRDHNYHQHQMRKESVQTGFAMDDTCVMRKEQKQPENPDNILVLQPADTSANPIMVNASDAASQSPEKTSPWLALPEAFDPEVSWVSVKNPAARTTRSNRVRVRAKSRKYFLDFGVVGENGAGDEGPTLHFNTIEIPHALARKLAEHLLRLMWEEEAGPLPELPRIAA